MVAAAAMTVDIMGKTMEVMMGVGVGVVGPMVIQMEVLEEMVTLGEVVMAGVMVVAVAVVVGVVMVVVVAGVVIVEEEVVVVIVEGVVVEAAIKVAGVEIEAEGAKGYMIYSII